MIRAALDTNVLVSGIRGLPIENSTLGRVMRLLVLNYFHLVVSDHIMAEFNRALMKPYFQESLSAEDIHLVRLTIKRKAEHVELNTPVQGIATHPEDDLVLATAVSGNADYLVTGDRGLLGVGRYEGVTIVTPRAFLDILDQEPA